jgi:CubicO group peptidase (beta-lactamase class C family)
MQHSIDALIASTSDHPAHTGLVVGVFDGARRDVFGYGAVEGERPGGDTLFEIGSVTKVFTTGLLSLLVAEETVTLDEPAASQSSELQGFSPQVTLRHLATHTAGLPKMPSNILGSMLRDRSNPYAAYSTQDLLRWLARRSPSQSRIDAGLVNYSNLGMGLLGTLLAAKLGQNYETAVRIRICEPLGMEDTRIQLPPDQAGRLAPPHSARGRRISSWDLPAFAGAGALRSTADDLLSFLAAQLGEPPTALTPALQDCHEAQSQRFAPPGLMQRLVARLSGVDLSNDRTREGMALGWTVGRLPSGDQVHWHHGATGGYRAYAGFVRSSGAGVVVLANSGLSMRDGILGTTATDRVGFAVLEQLSAAS